MKEDSEWLRKTAIERAGNDEDHETIWTSLGKSRAWFYKWLKRHRQGDDDWFRERSSAPGVLANRTNAEVEEIVQFARGVLYNRDMFCGAQAILWQLKDWNIEPLPSLRTINRILRRHDLTRKRTGRYRPKGVAYPAPEASRPNDVHQADFIGPRFLEHGAGKSRFYVFNCIDVATGRCAVQAITDGKSNTDAAIWQVWRRLGLPRYLQVDNEMTFAAVQTHLVLSVRLLGFACRWESSQCLSRCENRGETESWRSFRDFGTKAFGVRNQCLTPPPCARRTGFSKKGTTGTGATAN